MSAPQQEPGTCDGCWHDKPTGKCSLCHGEICAHCRNDKHPDRCDGCGSELPKPEAEADPDDTPAARADYLRSHAPEV